MMKFFLMLLITSSINCNEAIKHNEPKPTPVNPQPPEYDPEINGTEWNDAAKKDFVKDCLNETKYGAADGVDSGKCECNLNSWQENFTYKEYLQFHRKIKVPDNFENSKEYRQLEERSDKLFDSCMQLAIKERQKENAKDAKKS